MKSKIIKKKKFNINRYIFIFLISLSTLISFHFFKNLYEISYKNYNIRMEIMHGDCGGTSYSFLKYIKKNFQFNDNPAVYSEKNIPPSQNVWLYDSQKKILPNKVVLLNYGQSLKRVVATNGYKINLENYKLLYKRANCYLLEND
jgi:hypothetical protein